ncbi:PREDICTED: uncharacterized protein LOC104612361 isoform X2 [Nelumbo nucifera]|nr:PREDICTED: uncharacterized protein LOC104612361 isoform X2 [Nelumbo nucifera]XP_019055814.1 PREDICTED: uncharacterized protein LOC104612361 isoform X2 [Nelumbo nucifera]
MKLKPVALQLVGKLDRCGASKQNLFLSIGAPCMLEPSKRNFRVIAFKGSAQNDESGDRSGGCKFPKNNVKLSYVPHDGEETLTEPADREKVYTSEDGQDSLVGSIAIQKLFKKWLMMLRTQSFNQAPNVIFEEGLPQSEISESQNGIQKREAFKIFKAAWCYFMGLDAIIKVPLVIFIPWYLSVNVVYGPEVSKELTPLWVFGPLVMALYIKMLRGLCALYVFTFKQMVQVLKNLPTYYNYVAQGKLNDDLRAYFWQPVVDIKNLDYKEAFRKKLKEFEAWLVDKYLDFVESIWPYYCRTIRFLKRAHLI